MNPMTEDIPLVEMRNIKKSFAAVQALRGVDLILHHYEVLGLVGDNAAGKSTLMKILSGAYIPDEGEIFIEGKAVFRSSAETISKLKMESYFQSLDSSSLDHFGWVCYSTKVDAQRLGGHPWMTDRQVPENRILFPKT